MVETNLAPPPPPPPEKKKGISGSLMGSAMLQGTFYNTWASFLFKKRAPFYCIFLGSRNGVISLLIKFHVKIAPSNDNQHCTVSIIRKPHYYIINWIYNDIVMEYYHTTLIRTTNLISTKIVHSFLSFVDN